MGELEFSRGMGGKKGSPRGVPFLPRAPLFEAWKLASSARAFGENQNGGDQYLLSIYQFLVFRCDSLFSGHLYGNNNCF